MSSSNNANDIQPIIIGSDYELGFSALTDDTTGSVVTTATAHAYLLAHPDDATADALFAITLTYDSGSARYLGTLAAAHTAELYPVVYYVAYLATYSSSTYRNVISVVAEIGSGV